MSDNETAVEKLWDIIYHSQSIVEDILAAIQADPLAYGVVDKRIAELEAEVARLVATIKEPVKTSTARNTLPLKGGDA